MLKPKQGTEHQWRRNPATRSPPMSQYLNYCAAGTVESIPKRMVLCMLQAAATTTLGLLVAETTLITRSSQDKCYSPEFQLEVRIILYERQNHAGLSDATKMQATGGADLVDDECSHMLGNDKHHNLVDTRVTHPTTTVCTPATPR